MIRNFQTKQVPVETVNKILSLALHAPSAGFTQGWAYVVVRDRKVKQKIGELQGEFDFYSKRRHKFISEAPVLIVVCVSEELYHERYREPDKLIAGNREVEWTTPFWFFDIGAASLIIFLAAVNQGLGAAFTGIFRQREIRQLLRIPRKFQPVGVVSLGYPAKDVPSSSLKRGRRSLSEVVHYERW
jgi:nitroreductase